MHKMRIVQLFIFSGQSSECEYGCEKKTGNCYHFKQENHYHQHFAQVGDGNTYEFHSHGMSSYAPNFEEVEGVYWFGSVRPSVRP